jgi:type I restriction enzyme S subunit
MSWTKVELGEVVSFFGGGTPSRSNPEYWGGDIPWATVKDIKGPSLDVTIDSITEEGLKNSASRIVPRGSVILPTRMALGKAAITTVPIAINQDLKVVVPKRPLNSRFLLHFLQSASNQIQRLGAGDSNDLAASLPHQKSKHRCS